MMTKKLNELTLSELAEIHLSIYSLPRQLAGGVIYSSIGQLVTEIQQSRGFNNLRTFSPLYSSFALLDQIGCCYINKTLPICPNSQASGIKKALYYFNNIPYDRDEMKAIYGLRNSLIHDGSVIYRGRFEDGKWKGPFHHFIFGENFTKVVELPRIPWDGKFENLRHEYRTKVNQRLLTNMAIDAVILAGDLLKDGQLGFCIPEGEIELYYKYLFHFPS